MRVLFTSNPLAGHWLPMIPLARAAQQAGHDVVFATGSNAVPDLEGRGFKAWHVGPDFSTTWSGMLKRPRAESETGEQRTLADGLAMFADPVSARSRDLSEQAAHWLPDIVVREIYEFAGMYVPARLQVVHGLGTHDAEFTLLKRRALPQLRALLAEPAWEIPLSDTWYVDPVPPSLQPPNTQPFTHVLAMQAGAGEIGPDDELPARVLKLPRERTVYLTLGTVFNSSENFAMPLEALQDLPVNVVVTCGYDADPADFDPLPAHVAVERYVPQALLFPRCSAVVCHGGAGTVIGALTFGLPLVCLPQGADQFANAAQVSRVGAGITIQPNEVTARSIADAVQTVMARPSYQNAARTLQSEIALLPKPPAVAEELVNAARN